MKALWLFVVILLIFSTEARVEPATNKDGKPKPRHFDNDGKKGYDYDYEQEESPRLEKGK